MVEDVHVLQTHALETLVQAGQQILARSEIPIQSWPHVPAGLGADDQLIAVRAKILVKNAAEVLLCRSIRRAIVIGEIKVGNAEVEGPPQHSAAILKDIHPAEVMPQAHRDCGELDAASAAAPVGHGVVT